MAPTRTVYVRKEDEALWERVKELAGDSFSEFVTEALRRHVADVEEARALEPADGFERVLYTLGKIEELKERAEADLQRMRSEGKLLRNPATRRRK